MKLINTVQGLDEDSMVLITTYYSDVNNQRFEMDFVNRDVVKIAGFRLIKSMILD